VDVWHCDALGAYSDVGENGTTGQKWLRGSQITNAQGIARFTTIFPGWYQGRTVHIHFKIRTLVEGKTHDFTSQFFFNDALTEKIHAKQPYAQNGQRDVRNDRDGIYRESGGQLLLNLKPSGVGYTAKFDLGVDLSRSALNRGPGRGGPGEDGGPPPPMFGW